MDVRLLYGQDSGTGFLFKLPKPPQKSWNIIIVETDLLFHDMVCCASLQVIQEVLTAFLKG